MFGKPNNTLMDGASKTHPLSNPDGHPSRLTMPPRLAQTIEPPSRLDEIDRITDFKLSEFPFDGKPKGGYADHAMCWYGEPKLAFLRDTEIAEWLRGLNEEIDRHHSHRNDFRIVYDGRMFRGHRSMGARGPVLDLRRIPPVTPTLEDLSYRPMWVPLFMQESLNKGGLILIASVTGQGKSTTAAAIVKSRCLKFAGHWRTVEDPIELPLEGVEGEGLIVQNEVIYPGPGIEDRETGFAGGLRGALRAFPATRPAGILVGEVRDGETAAELVRAAVNGMLVITTIHAHDTSSALSRLVAMAKMEMGDIAPEMVASAIRLVIYQNLKINPLETGWRRGSYSGTVLSSDGDSHPVANVIKDERFPALADEINRQSARLQQMAMERRFGEADLSKELGTLR